MEIGLNLLQKKERGVMICLFFLAASMLKKKIILLPVYPDDGHGQSGQIIVDPDETIGNPLHLLYYKDVHFQSIVPIDYDESPMAN